MVWFDSINFINEQKYMRLLLNGMCVPIFSIFIRSVQRYLWQKKQLFCIKNRKICFIFHLNIPIVAKRDNATLSVMCSFLLSRGSHNFIGMMMATSLRTGTETISSTLAAEILRYTKVQLQLHHYVFHHRFCMHFHDIFVIKTHNSRGSSHHQTSLIGLLLIAYICKCG